MRKAMKLLTFQYYYAYFTFVSAVFTNSVLLFFLFLNPNKKLGNYRYLMFSFSFVALFFTLIDFLNKPLSHVSDGAFIIFSMNTLGLPIDLAEWLNALNCSCFGVTISLLSVHFIYRYLAVCRPGMMNLFTCPSAIVWVLFCFGTSFEWFLAAKYLAPKNEIIDQVIGPNMQTVYNISMNEIIYQGASYYETNPDGSKSLDTSSILFVFNVNFITVFCLFIILFFGTATFRKMKTLKLTSRTTNNLQKQLFSALLVQTIIPFITMFSPACVIMMGPFLEITIGSVEILMMSFITTYPVLDPLVVLYFVKDYRQLIFKYVTCRKNTLDVTRASTSFSMNQRNVFYTSDRL